MIVELRIRQLALLDAVALELGPGFTAVTGETGAGKSILLGALSLLSGARADKSAIRQGAEAAEVEATLQLADPRPVDALLASLGLPPCEEGALLLRRTLPREKPPRITINGSLATLANLQALGGLWIDFHGPAEPRRLLKPACQLELLDRFGNNEGALGAYRGARAAWLAAKARREETASAGRLSPDQVDFLRRQLALFDSIDLSDEAVAGLERGFQRLSSMQELTTLATSLASGLRGDDGLLSRLSPVVREARQLARLDPASQPLSARLDALAVEADDLGREFEALAASLNLDPDEARSLEERMNTWLDLKRRHGPDAAAVRAAREETACRLESQGDIAGTLARLDAEIATLRKELDARAATLREARMKAAGELARKGAKLIAGLGFAHAEFRVEIEPLPEPGPDGACACTFLFSPNAGEPLLPLARIASSGELARVMLALKTLLADIDEIPVLVFDEVDANVGGEIGGVVGANLARIGGRHQVICVTHLPQVAAKAASHLVVEKQASGGRTLVSITAVHDDRGERLGELARMLGDRRSKSALAHAGKLLPGGGCKVIPP